MKPRVYIETSIPSYLTARQNNDLRAMANQNTTIEWWENRKPEFDIYISEFVVAESSQGDPEAAARRLNAIENIPEIKHPRRKQRGILTEGSGLFYRSKLRGIRPIEIKCDRRRTSIGQSVGCLRSYSKRI